MNTPSQPLDAQARKFLRLWALALGAVAISLLLFCVIMDPYALFNTPKLPGLNSRKPAIATQARVMRAYDVKRGRPHTVILGSSRAAWGLDGGDSAWPEQMQPVYNLAFPNGSPHIAYQYLQYVMATDRVPLVVLGLEFEYFLTYENPGELDYMPRALSPHGTQYFHDVLRYSFTLQMIEDGSTELLANFSRQSPDMSQGRWDLNTAQRLGEQADLYPLFALTDVYLLHWYARRPADFSPLADLKSILDLCRSSGARVIVFISPSHAHELEILHLTGQWPSFEAWKRELVSLVAQYTSPPHLDDVQLWDFSAYDAYSTEPPSSGKAARSWFWNTNHYNRILGRLLVQRLFGGGDLHFGRQLTGANVEGHLQRVREGERLYQERYPAEAQRIAKISALALQAPADVASLPQSQVAQ